MHGAETTYQYDGGLPVENGRLATWLFLAAETLFFGGLISAWFVLRSQTPTWHEGEPPSLATGLIMTVLLVSASFVSHGAIGAAKEARHKGIVGRIGFAALLAFSFLCLQAVEYAHLVEQGITPATSLRWGVFYALTLAHGLHVFIGVLWLVWLLKRAVGSTGLAGDARGPLEYGVLYMHFVDAVWLVLLLLLYVLH